MKRGQVFDWVKNPHLLAIATIASAMVAILAYLIPRGPEGVASIPAPAPIREITSSIETTRLVSTTSAGISSPAIAGQPDIVGAISRSPWLGVEFWQNGERISLTKESNPSKFPERVNGGLLSAPFEIGLPELDDSDVVRIAVSTNESLLLESDPAQFFGRGSGYSSAPAGKEYLVVNRDGRPGFNYFNRGMTRSTQAGLSTIRIADLQKAGSGGESLARPWGTVYFLILRQPLDPPATPVPVIPLKPPYTFEKLAIEFR